MSRHTHDDGITPNLDITPDKYDGHCAEFGPRSTLIGSYNRKEIDWTTFARRYREYLLSDDMQTRIRELVKHARQTDITLLCIESEPTHCHRRLLAEACQEIDPKLKVDIG
jgi:uncharacterized protein YeaO (DUF488 family)